MKILRLGFLGLLAGLALRMAFAAYLFLSEAGWLVGLREFEYSWQSSGSSRT